MQTVVLAAGDGTRLHPLTDATPKPLLPVGRNSLLRETALTAVRAGASALYVVVPLDHDAFRDALGESVEGVPVEYVVQPRPCGTADAVQRAARRFEGPFAVLPGDAVFDPGSLAGLLDGVPTVGVDGAPTGTGPSTAVDRAVGDGGSTGLGGAADAADRCRTGACSLPASVHDRLEVGIRETGEREFSDVLDRVERERAVRTVEHRYHVDVDHPTDLLTAMTAVLEARATDPGWARVEGAVSDRAALHGPVFVESGARVERGAVVLGPTVLDAGATVAADAVVGPNTYVGPGVEVGAASRVSQTLLQRGTRLGSGGSLAYTVVGAHARLRPGTTVGGRELAEDAAAVRTGTPADVETAASLCTVLGPHVETGVGTSIAGGVTLTTGATTPPDAHVTTDR